MTNHHDRQGGKAKRLQKKMEQKNERKIKKNKEKRRKITKPSFGVNKSF